MFIAARVVSGVTLAVFRLVKLAVAAVGSSLTHRPLLQLDHPRDEI
jgi:hypothetical protein